MHRSLYNLHIIGADLSRVTPEYLDSIFRYRGVKLQHICIQRNVAEGHITFNLKRISIRRVIEILSDKLNQQEPPIQIGILETENAGGKRHECNCIM